MGRDLEVTKTTDLLKDIPQEKIDKILDGLTPSQTHCLTTHCRNIPNGINMILGPFGSGKTVLVSKLCELQKAQKPDSKSFVTASSNSACDAVVPKFQQTELMVVRAHALSLEPETLLEPYFERQRAGILGEADPLPDDYQPLVDPKAARKPEKISVEGGEDFEFAQATDDESVDASDDDSTGKLSLSDHSDEEDREDRSEESSSEDSNGDDKMPDDLLIRATLDVMKVCKEKYESRRLLEDPKDKYMQQVDVAIHTWMLKFAGVIGSEHSIKPSEPTKPKSTEQELPEELASDRYSAEEKDHLFNLNTCTSFRSLYQKSATQRLNDEEWVGLKACISPISQMVLRAANVVVATAVQGQTDLLKDIVFDHVIFDEASTITHTEMLCAWRRNEDLTLVCDLKQLPPTTLSTKSENPFAIVQSYGPFQRFADIGMPIYVLKHVMRMTAGFEDLCNKIFYKYILIYRPGTSVSDPNRRLSVAIQDFYQRFPEFQQAPDDLVYPIFLHVPGECFKEPDGSSRMNTHNIAVIIGVIQDLLDKHPEINLDQIGIASPYAAQVRETRKALRRANMDGIRVGVTESWQGGERDVMIVDFVRAKTPDLGVLGFLAMSERLNVLLSRQKQFLIVVGDKNCCDTKPDSTEPVTDEPAEARDDADNTKAAATWDYNDKKNSSVLKILAWFKEHGRVLDIPIDVIQETYVKLPKPEEEVVGDGGWGDSWSEQKGEQEPDKKDDPEPDKKDEQEVEDDEARLRKLKQELMKMEIEDLEEKLE